MLKIAFICIHNSCRSQMAEAIAKHYLKGFDVEIYSAGTEKYPEIKPLVFETLELKGIPIIDQYPKLLEEIPKKVDILITMGCGVECPFLPANKRYDWGLEDPSGKGLEAFNRTRDLIIDKVLALKKDGKHWRKLEFGV